MKTRIFRQLPFIAAVGVSLGLLVAILWQRSPILAVALAGPVAALVLYERSIRRSRSAMRLALTDPLTGLGNQRAFRDRLRRELAEAKAAGRPLALCVLDVDDFKRINDEHGHPTGDRVLTEVATALRHDGEAFRLGGDEFALLLVGVDAGAAVTAGQSVVGRVDALRVADVGRVTVSGGLASFPDDGASREGLTAAADERLYRAKRAGGNQLAAPGEPLAAAGNEG